MKAELMQIEQEIKKCKATIRLNQRQARTFNQNIRVARKQLKIFEAQSRKLQRQPKIEARQHPRKKCAVCDGWAMVNYDLCFQHSSFRISCSQNGCNRVAKREQSECSLHINQRVENGSNAEKGE